MQLRSQGSKESAQSLSSTSINRHIEDHVNVSGGVGVVSSPAVSTGSKLTEAQTVLLCLDYLRSLRRSNHGEEELMMKHGIHEDYVTLAIWALTRCFASPKELVLDTDLYSTQTNLSSFSGEDEEQDKNEAISTNYELGNDPFFQHELSDSNFKLKSSPSNVLGKLTKNITIPTIDQMEDEILYKRDPKKITKTGKKGKSHDTSPTPTISWYEYEDMHYSNQHRFYKFDGLDSTPISLQDLIAIGLDEMKGMSRTQGEEIMMKDCMFTDFMDAVKAKGFFNVTEKDILSRNGMGMLTSKKKRNAVKDQIYQERYRKVKNKFRHKLVEKYLENEDARKREEGDAVDAGRAQRKDTNTFDDEATVTGSVVVDIEHAKENGTLHYDDSNDIAKKSRPSTSHSNSRRMSMTAKPSRRDVEDAEKLKMSGNACMQQKKYEKAKNFYTMALEIAPAGPTSHVYYSNRAAALLSMRNFTEAVWDAERSIALKPDYPKAHARLGLAHFLLGQYVEAVESYTLALEYEPKNQTSLSYLERSKKKLAMMNREDDDVSVNSSSRQPRSERRKTILKSRRSSVAISKSSIHAEFEPQERDVSPDKKMLNRAHEEKNRDQEDKYESYGSSILDVSSEQNIDEANRLKIEGNKAMARKEYSTAIKLYSKALKFAPAGPQSHVFFSNRAAALCYLERYEEAELDAERALALNPEFGKAHARLGLSRYFLKDYVGAVDAYESAATYDPDNESNRIYLAKAKLKLGRRQSLASARE